MASTSLRRTLSGNGNQNTATWSFWVKRGNITDGRIYTSWYDGSNQFWIMFQNGKLNVKLYQNSYLVDVETNRLFRDTSAFYHIVVAIDTTQGTASDRVKIYVNGSQETSLANSSYPNQNASIPFGLATYNQRISERDGQDYFDGLMSHFHFIDGTAYDASTFGQTDATTGIWKPKTAPSVTYGTNGFFLKFENSGSMGLDSSGNANNFTVNGTMTQTVDTPSNVFATWNPLNMGRYNNSPALATFTNGNTRVKFTDATYDQFCSATYPITIGGNWYWEVKLSASPNSGHIGIYDAPNYDTGTPNNKTGTYIYRYNGDKIVNGATPTSFGSTYTNGDIIGFAFNGTSGTLWVSKNGVWQNSATQSEIEAGTTTNSLATGIDTTKDLFPYIQDYNNSQYDANFGNGYFGTTAVSSATSDESGLGIFEYTVPSGYYALCTKNINTQG